MTIDTEEFKSGAKRRLEEYWKNNKKDIIRSAVVLGVFAVIIAGSLIANAVSERKAAQAMEDSFWDTQETVGPEWKTDGTKRVKADEDYVVVAENSDYRLSYYEPTFSIRLENVRTGAVIESTVSDEMDDGMNNENWTGYIKSGIVLNAIIGTTNTYQVDMCNSSNDIETFYIDNGICANIYFKEYKFGLSVEVTLDGSDLVVRVPEGSIYEQKPGTYISTVSLFPMMGYTHLGETEGYMLIPDGNGALIYLNDKEGRYSTGFSRMIYGADDGFEQNTPVTNLWTRYETVTEPNNVVAPVFGMAHTEEQTAYLGVVESGDERCSIEAHPNGVMINYNRCFAKFLLRDIFVQPLNNSNSGTVVSVESDRIHTDLQVRYRLLGGDDADYSGMANSYREYLLENSLIRQADCGYNTRVDFLGTDREEFLLGTTAVTMTTVDDMEKMLAGLRENGVDSVISVYKGWQDGGVYNLPITGFTTDRHIGSADELAEFIRRQKELGYTVYLYDDALLMNEDTNTFTFDAMKMVSKRTFKKETNGQVYDLFYYLLPSKADQYLSSLIGELNGNGVDTVAVAGISDRLFSYSSKGRYYSRTDTRDSFEATVSAADETCALALENPNAYLWKYADAYLDMPVDASDYLYEDEAVPFLSMVLKGVVPMYAEYVNFEANKTENLLQMVESGVYPSFYLTWENASKLIYTNSSGLYSLEYSSYCDTVAQYDAELGALAEKTAGAHIIKHEIIDSGFVKVSYDNGTVVYVNYNSTARSADGQTVAALSYKAGE